RSRHDQMRLEWGTREQGGYSGWLQVAGIGGGASEVTVHLSFFDDDHDPGEKPVGDALDTSLRRLEEQVRLRVDHAAGCAGRRRCVPRPVVYAVAASGQWTDEEASRRRVPPGEVHAWHPGPNATLWALA